MVEINETFKSMYFFSSFSSAPLISVVDNILYIFSVFVVRYIYDINRGKFNE